jgi:hypothetical protein
MIEDPDSFDFLDERQNPSRFAGDFLFTEPFRSVVLLVLQALDLINIGKTTTA